MGGARGAAIGAVIGFLAVLMACGSSTSGADAVGSCSNDYSGEWAISGSCDESSCTVTQASCRLSVACGNGTKLTGNITGSTASLSGTRNGQNGSCDVSLTGSALTLACGFGTVRCNATGQCESGKCGAPIGGTTDASADTSTPPSDSSVATDTSFPPVMCTATPPVLFPPKAGAGPYCKDGQAGDRCDLGATCCHDLASGVRSCTLGACTSPAVPTRCYSSSECPGGTICCGKGAPTVGLCPYLVVADYGGSICSASCRTGEYQGCAATAECATGTCTAAALLNPDRNYVLGTQVGVCR